MVSQRVTQPEVSCPRRRRCLTRNAADGPGRPELRSDVTLLEAKQRKRPFVRAAR